MTFNILSGSTPITSYTYDGIPYLWKSGDCTTLPSVGDDIKASDGDSNDVFGWSVAIDSGRIVVGAPRDDDNGTNSGSVYIFDLNGDELAKITPSDGVAGDEFGISVAVGCGRIVASSPYSDDNGEASGSAYIFDLDGNQLTKITPPNSTELDNFGISVAVGCGRIVISSIGDDDNAVDAGAAYIYDLDGNQLTKITAPDGTAGDLFGYSVSVGSGKIVVGSPLGIDNGTDSGSAYVFDLDGNFLSKIKQSDGVVNDYFGYSISVGSGRIVVGAVNSTINNVLYAGSAYIFDLDGNFLTKITAPDGGEQDLFGWSVAVGLGRIVVGALNNTNANGTYAGAAYVYDLDGNYLSKIIAFDDANNADSFGRSVAVGSGKIVVGSYRSDAEGLDSGAAYTFNTPQVITLYDAIEFNSPN